jgi:hypothetical protein
MPSGVNIEEIIGDRHPGTRDLARYFTKVDPASSPQTLDVIRTTCQALAMTMIMTIADGPELTTGLRKLLEAKDCFVRAAL